MHIIFEYREYRQDPWTQLFKRLISLLIGLITIQRISIRKTNCVIHWIEIHEINNVIQLSNNWVQIPLTCDQAFSSSFFLT